MKTPHYWRRFLLFAAPLIAALAVGVGGCDIPDGPESTQPQADAQGSELLVDKTGVERARAACAQYQGLGNIYGYCLSKYVVAIMSVKDMLPMCAEAGEWADRCRHTWVTARQRLDAGYSTSVLLNACMGNEDCIFELIDFRHADDVYAQAERCVAWTDVYQQDCVGHAIQRWYIEDHSASEIEEMISTLGPANPERVSFWVAAAVACDGIGSCGSTPEISTMCEERTKRLESGRDRCPPKLLKSLGAVGIGNGQSTAPSTPPRARGATPPRARGATPPRPR